MVGCVADDNAPAFFENVKRLPYKSGWYIIGVYQDSKNGRHVIFLPSVSTSLSCCKCTCPDFFSSLVPPSKASPAYSGSYLSADIMAVLINGIRCPPKIKKKKTFICSVRPVQSEQLKLWVDRFKNYHKRRSTFETSLYQTHPRRVVLTNRSSLVISRQHLCRVHWYMQRFWIGII